MEKRVLGNSGITVSAIGIGCWAIGGVDWNLGMSMGWAGVDDTKSLSGLIHAYELGATYFDTADVYGHGHSERLIGQFLKRVRREHVVVGSKLGYFIGTAPYAYHPLHMRHQLETSLINLKTDYLDILFLHNANFGEGDYQLDSALEMMRSFKEEGLIRAIGFRGPHTYAVDRAMGVSAGLDKYERFVKLASYIRPDAIQVRYNMLTPTYDTSARDIFSWAESRGVGIFINKPLGQGLLLDKYDPCNPPQFPDGDHRCRKRWFTSEALSQLRPRLQHVKKRFGDSTGSLMRVALQYCLSRSSNACVIAGFKTKEQVEMILGVEGQHLSQEELQFVQNAMSGTSNNMGNVFGEGTVHG